MGDEIPQVPPVHIFILVMCNFSYQIIGVNGLSDHLSWGV